MIEKSQKFSMRLQTVLKKVWFIEGFSFLFALLIFSWILSNAPSTIFGTLAHKARISFAEFIPFFILLLYAAFQIRGPLGRFFSITLVFMFFALSLGGLWETGQSQSTVLNGIVPLFDASRYYSDALRLIAGQDLSSFSARRPLFAGLFAVLLTISGRNLMVALAILAATTAAACYLAAREIQRTHGAEAAVLVLTILYLFYRYNNGLVMSEGLGLSLGVLGFALIWRGASELQQRLVWFGLFVSTLALNARAGAFFVLPFVLVWGGWIFSRPANTNFLKFVIPGLAAIGGGFLAHWLVVPPLPLSLGVLFFNFFFTF